MAGILNPKSRFFDTYLTQEGRRQLSSGELRMRYVSFSDGLTGYEQSDKGVIDSKDGAVFFEAMSRPQDSIITENPSIVNMMGVREGFQTPAFLFQKDENGEVVEVDGRPQRIQASMFGDQIIKPPDGRTSETIEIVTSSGGDSYELEYDLATSFYVSSSLTKEIYYDASGGRLKGWYVFDDAEDQLATVGTSIDLSDPYFRNTISHLDFHIGSAVKSLDANNVGSNADFELISKRRPIVGESFTYEKFTAKISKASLSENNKHYVIRFSNHNLASLSGNSQAIITETNSPLDFIPQARLGKFGEINDKVSQNLSASSGLSTNAFYKKFSNGVGMVNDATPTFSGFSLPVISKKEKSYQSLSDNYIHAVVEPSEHITIDLDTNLGQRLEEKYSYQFSTWFYVRQEAGAKTNTIMQGWRIHEYSGKKQKFKIVTIASDLIFFLYDNAASPTAYRVDGAEPKITGHISYNKWHRVSLAMNINHIILVLDGTLEKSIRLDPTPAAFDPVFISDMILGNDITDLDETGPAAAFSNNTWLDGYLQEFQYFLTAAVDDHQPPVFDTPSGPFGDFVEYYSLVSRLALPSLDGTSFWIDDINGYLQEDANNLYYSFNDPGITPNPSLVEANPVTRQWINFYPIYGEAALYYAISLKAYVKETPFVRGARRLTIDELIENSQLVMSGTVESYKDLQLLGHLDLNVLNNEQGFKVRRWGLNDDDSRGNERDPNGTTLLETRYDVWPMIETAYGRKNYYRGEVDHISRRTPSPFAGRFFMNEATVFNLGEVLDNDLDKDPLTVSSTRLPNFVFLPPIAKEDFIFDNEDPANRGFMQTLEKLYWKSEHRDNTYGAVIDYVSELNYNFRSILPDSVLRRFVNQLNPSANDSNYKMVQYLTRTVNSLGAPYSNAIQFDHLRKFDEEIEFTETSEFNHTFVQAFESSLDEGKAKFKKLVIRDLGVFRKKNADQKEYRPNRSFKNSESSNQVASAENSDVNHRQNVGELVHVFAFGKLITDKSQNNPGVDIYFTPIFVIEFLIDNNVTGETLSSEKFSDVSDEEAQEQAQEAATAAAYATKTAGPF